MSNSKNEDLLHLQADYEALAARYKKLDNLVNPRIKFYRASENVQVPEYQTPGSAGFDICANLDFTIELFPDERILIPTGLFVEIPEGYEIQIRSRSGLAYNQLVVLNSPGTIDSDYRGELMIMLKNLGKEPILINNKDRIAQGIISKVYRFDWEEDTNLSSSARGSNGFGSTGL